MKKTMTLVIAAAAAAMTLVSCTKELPSEGTITKDGLRTLTVSFASSPTKTTVDGLQPKWSANDEILLADGEGTETITVSAANAGKTSFEITTNLTGTITAVYPKSAAATSGNSITGIKVSATQDGSFGSANICKATAAATEKELTFENQTAVFKVNVPNETKQLIVTSLNPVSDGKRATSGAVAIADASATIITVGNNTADIPNPCYVSVLAPATGAVLLQDLNFDTGSAQGGFSPKYITDKGKTPSSYAVEVNTMYTLEAASLHEYVTVDGKKWATMNVGATTVAGNYTTCYGDLYQWGSVETIYNERPWTSAIAGSFTNKWKDGKGNGYSWNTYCGKDFFQEWDPVPYDATTKILNFEKDAATQNWGTGWRMPTSAEFKALKSATYWKWDDTDKGYYVYAPQSDGDKGKKNSDSGVTGTYNKSAALLFFPAAGNGSGTYLYNAGEGGIYWSSTLNSSNAYSLLFYSNIVNQQYLTDRSSGCSVRPVSD